MKYLIGLFLVFSVLAGNTQNSHEEFNVLLRTGDLLFCSSPSGELSRAIDEVTQTGKETHYSHVGIVEVRSDTVWVLHAAPGKGVCRETIRQFLSPEKEKITATVYRLKKNYLKSVPSAIEKAYSLLGQDYNYSYILKDQGYYCSEYIYELFAADSVFKLKPMTFKNPETGQFIDEWVDHYQQLQIPVPEGEPGCNPNGMSASVKLELVGVLRFKDKD